MTEITSAIVAVLITALISYIVFAYRPKIIYRIQSASDCFSLIDGKLEKSDAWDALAVEIGTLELSNPSLKDVDDFDVWLGSTYGFINARLDHASTLAEGAIGLEISQGGIKISLASFPKKERIRVILSRRAGIGGLTYETPKKGSGKFKLVSKDDDNSLKDAITFFAYMSLGISSIYAFAYLLGRMS